MVDRRAKSARRFETGSLMEPVLFRAAGVIDGRTVHTRVIWSDIARSGARWQQSASLDGVRWAVNWVN